MEFLHKTDINSRSDLNWNWNVTANDCIYFCYYSQNKTPHLKEIVKWIPNQKQQNC